MAKIITYQGSMDAIVWHKEYKNIDCDTEITVPVAHEAVFIKDGRIAESFSMGRHILRENCVGEGRLFSAGDEKVSCRVYYIKKEGAYNIKWAAPQPLCLVDPVLKIPVEFDISGVFAIKIIDSKKFLIKLLANTQNAALDEVKDFFRGRMLTCIKEHLIAALLDGRISMIELPHRLMSFSKDLELRLRYIFENSGVSIEGFMLKKIDLLSGGEKCEIISVPPFAAGIPEKQDTTVSAGEVMYCPKCGVDLPPLSVYCLKCGAKTGE